MLKSSNISAHYQYQSYNSGAIFPLFPWQAMPRIFSANKVDYYANVILLPCIVQGRAAGPVLFRLHPQKGLTLCIFLA